MVPEAGLSGAASGRDRVGFDGVIGKAKEGPTAEAAGRGVSAELATWGDGAATGETGLGASTKTSLDVNSEATA